MPSKVAPRVPPPFHLADAARLPSNNQMIQCSSAHVEDHCIVLPCRPSSLSFIEAPTGSRVSIADRVRIGRHNVTSL